MSYSPISSPYTQSSSSTTHLNLSTDLDVFRDVNFANSKKLGDLDVFRDVNLANSKKLGDFTQAYNQQPLFERLRLNDVLDNTFKVQKDLTLATQMQSLPPLPPLKIPSFVLPERNLDKGWSEISTCVEEDIPEDSIYRKLIACIPILGAIPTLMNNISLNKKIAQTKEPIRLVKLIIIKNQYKIASIIRIALPF